MSLYYAVIHEQPVCTRTSWEFVPSAMREPVYWLPGNMKLLLSEKVR